MTILSFECEKYFRMAYDCMYYESSLKLAKKYISKALSYDNCHKKSLILQGTILICYNKTQEAINCFKSVLNEDSENFLCFSYLASLYNIENDYRKALVYANRALSCTDNNKELMTECLRLKINLLINLKLYKKAKKTLDSLKYYLLSNDIDDLKQEFACIMGDIKTPYNKGFDTIRYIY